MKVTLKSQNTGDSFNFLDEKEYVANYGYLKSKRQCYEKNVIKTKTFKATGFGGFFENSPSQNFTNRGVGQVGSDYLGSIMGAKIITINFQNVFSAKIGGSSPNQGLAKMLNDPNDIINVIVRTDKYTTYELEFYSLPDSSLEAGIIALETAYADYLKAENVKWEKNFSYSEYIVVTQDQLQNDGQGTAGIEKGTYFEVNNPFEEMNMNYEIGTIYNSTVSWNKTLLINYSVGKMSFFNSYGHRIIKVDGDNEKTTDKDTGALVYTTNTPAPRPPATDTDYLKLKNGMNIMEFRISFSDTATGRENGVIIHIYKANKTFVDVIDGGIIE